MNFFFADLKDRLWQTTVVLTVMKCHSGSRKSLISIPHVYLVK